jgi:class 3 adenylate cyclase
MTEERLERRLAAILAADVVGYSRLVGIDEEGTLAALKALRLPALGNQRSYADNRVMDELGKPIAHLCAHFIVRLAGKTLGRREPAQVRDSLDIPDDDPCRHLHKYRPRSDNL